MRPYKLFFERGEFQERIEVAEDFGDVGGERVASGGGGRELFADDPGLKLWPVGGGGPAVVFGPFTLYRGVPVAVVFLAKAFFLLGEPLRILRDARFGD